MTRDPHDVADLHLCELLAQWHGWRRGWSHERGFARCAMWTHGQDQDELEQLQLQALERAYGSLTQDQQLAVAHIARAQFLGVDVFRSPRLMAMANRETLMEHAMEDLRDALEREGVL